MTQTEYSRHKGVELAAVKRAIAEGRIPSLAIKMGSNQRKLIIVAEADKFWQENTIVNNKNELRQKSLNIKGEAEQARDDGPIDDEPDPNSPTLNKFRTVREGYSAKLEQIKYEEKVGKLVNTDDVRRAVQEIGANIKNTLENFADKLSPLMAAENDIDKCHKIIRDEVEAVLSSLSRGEYFFIQGGEK